MLCLVLVVCESASSMAFNGVLGDWSLTHPASQCGISDKAISASGLNCLSRLAVL